LVIVYLDDISLLVVAHDQQYTIHIMHKRSGRGKRGPEDVNETAFRVVEEATANLPEEKNSAAVRAGRLGGAVGGRARAMKLTPEQRSEIARVAAHARWKKT
jgi:hypothetical protein